MGKSDRARRTRMIRSRPKVERTPLPTWIKPQLSRLVTKAPDGSAWAHELKYDGYRMHARLDRGARIPSSHLRRSILALI